MYMSSAIKILPHYNYDDYCNWQGRWEIIEGIPYAMSPAPNPKHQWVLVNILSEFRVAVKNSNCKNCKVYDFIDIKITEDTIVQPDASIVCKPILKPFLDFAPTLVVEILSPATALKDRHTKFALYEKMGIKYFLIIDAALQVIEIYTLINNQYEKTAFEPSNEFTFQLDDDCNIGVILNNIWE
jgi:Uma2 family endonuclease